MYVMRVVLMALLGALSNFFESTAGNTIVVDQDQSLEVPHKWYQIYTKAEEESCNRVLFSAITLT